MLKSSAIIRGSLMRRRQRLAATRLPHVTHSCSNALWRFGKIDSKLEARRHSFCICSRIGFISPKIFLPFEIDGISAELSGNDCDVLSSTVSTHPSDESRQHGSPLKHWFTTRSSTDPRYLSHCTSRTPGRTVAQSEGVLAVACTPVPGSCFGFFAQNI